MYKLSLLFLQVIFFYQVSATSDTLKPKTNDSLKKVTTGYLIKQDYNSLPYMVNTVDGNSLQNTRRENFVNALQGRVPGLTVTQTSGLPGASSNIVLRGPKTMGFRNEPIFVLDGVVINSGAVGISSLSSVYDGKTLDFSSRISDLSSFNIEEVTILKGPEATALYGSQGANGAIIITSKKGVNGKPIVTYDGSVRFEMINKLPEIQTEFGRGISGLSGSNLRIFFGPKFNASTKLYNNIDNFFKNGLAQQHNIAVQGGNDKVSYRFNTNYNSHSGVVPNTKHTRFIFGSANSFKLSNKLQLHSNINFTNVKVSAAFKGNDGYLHSLITWPVDDDASTYLNANGERRVIGVSSFNEMDNPFFSTNKNFNLSQVNRLNANVQLHYKVVNNLNIALILGYDKSTSNGQILFHPESRVGSSRAGFYEEYVLKNTLLNGVLKFSYNKTVGKFSHQLEGIYFVTNSKNDINTSGGERFINTNNSGMANTNLLTQVRRNFNYFNEPSGGIVMYKINYQKILSISSVSRFDAIKNDFTKAGLRKARNNFFWSVGSNFLFTSLYKPNKWLNMGMIRFNIGQSNLGTEPSTPLSIVSNNYKPKTNEFEVGTELHFLNNALQLNVAYYQHKTSNQFMPARAPYGSGAILTVSNSASVLNKGLEIQISSQILKDKNLKWNLTLNYSKNVNKILSLPFGYTTINDFNAEYGLVTQSYSVGSSIGELSYTGWARNKNGDLIIKANTGLPFSNPSGIVNTKQYAQRAPNYTYSFVSDLQIKNNWQLSFNIDCRQGGDVFNGTEYFMYINGASKSSLDRQQSRIIPGVLNDGLENSANPTRNNIFINPYLRTDYYSSASPELFIEKNIYTIRLKDVTLMYTLPTSVLKKNKFVKKASFYLTATDLFLITNYSGLDPISNAINGFDTDGFGGVGIDVGSIPLPRAINFGVTFQF